MSDDPEVTKAAMALSARMRRDPEARRSVLLVLARHECDTLADLAAKDPTLIAGLVEFFNDLDENDSAIDGWLQRWKPANLDGVV